MIEPGQDGVDGDSGTSARSSGYASLNAGLRGSFGEFRHWEAYMSALAAANRPEPNPTLPLSVF